MNYLGIIVGRKISFLNGICNSASVYIGCVIYKSIMAPRFEYFAILITNMDETRVGTLQRAQNRAENHITP